jgi:YHS domain-containing protein
MQTQVIVPVVLCSVVIAGCSSGSAREQPGVEHSTQAVERAMAPEMLPTQQDRGPSAPAAETAVAPSAAALTRVEDASAVCMVNNTYMGRPQIPVEVEGRTYFGCCEMCKGRLETDPSSRYATDPVSGRQVDKSGAVIGRDSSNRVLYFESESTYRKYAGT